MPRRCGPGHLASTAASAHASHAARAGGEPAAPPMRTEHAASAARSGTRSELSRLPPSSLSEAPFASSAKNHSWLSSKASVSGARASSSPRSTACIALMSCARVAWSPRTVVADSAQSSYERGNVWPSAPPSASHSLAHTPLHARAWRRSGGSRSSARSHSSRPYPCTIGRPSSATLASSRHSGERRARWVPAPGGGGGGIAATAKDKAAAGSGGGCTGGE
mmetsp:Transcript_42702/g.100241  ORF Transcript_42702/g.100241 Transcript_42702/m.100241 type:complete len:221 (+) Transcript_42702:917-1579(+)